MNHINKTPDQDQGFTLLEVLLALGIIGILSAITMPLIMWANNPVQNATSQTSGILTQGRSRAIATTSSLRIKPDPSSPNTTFKVEASNTRSCNSGVTELVGSHTNTKELTVLSTKGFAVGDELQIGSDSKTYSVLTTNQSNSTLTLGSPITTSHANGSAVAIVSNWSPDKTFFAEDMTLPDKTAMSSNLSDWTVCFDSRGIATITDASGATTTDLEIVLDSEDSGKTGKIVVFQGGMIDSSIVKQEISSEAIVALNEPESVPDETPPVASAPEPDSPPEEIVTPDPAPEEKIVADESGTEESTPDEVVDESVPTEDPVVEETPIEEPSVEEQPVVQELQEGVVVEVPVEESETPADPDPVIEQEPEVVTEAPAQEDQEEEIDWIANLIAWINDFYAQQE